MFNPIQVVIDAFVQQLQKQYEQVYGMLEPGYPGIIEFIARLAMENIANRDAPYHDMNHTIMVTLKLGRRSYAANTSARAVSRHAIGCIS